MFIKTFHNRFSLHLLSCITIAFVFRLRHQELSICLFHAKFGGPCLSVDFQNTRPTMGSQGSSVYDTSLLKGWTDEPDRQAATTSDDVKTWAMDAVLKPVAWRVLDLCVWMVLVFCFNY